MIIIVITVLAAAIIAAFCTYKWTMATVKETIGKTLTGRSIGFPHPKGCRRSAGP